MKTIQSSITLLLLLFSGIVLGQQSNSTIKVPNGKQIATEKLHAYIQQTMDSLKLPGLSIAIINDDKIVYHDTFGVKNIETNAPVTKETIFEGASLSKPLFAYFLMKMAEKKALNLDEPIYPYLEPIFPKGSVVETSLDNYKTLTPRIILSHGSGMPNWAKGKPIEIAFTPGTDFSYSGEAYQHLGAAFALKHQLDWGKQLDSLFLQEVARPLGMDHTLYTWDTRYDQAVANGHINGEVNPNINRYKKVGPGFSLHSDAEDYALFLIEMMHPKNITKETRDEMLKEHNHFTADNPLRQETGQTGWGLGFAQKLTPYGLMHLHTGNNQDFQAYAMFIPEQNYGFVMFANSNNLFPFLTKLEQLIGTHF